MLIDFIWEFEKLKHFPNDLLIRFHNFYRNPILQSELWGLKFCQKVYRSYSDSSGAEFLMNTSCSFWLCKSIIYVKKHAWPCTSKDLSITYLFVTYLENFSSYLQVLWISAVTPYLKWSGLSSYIPYWKWNCDFNSLVLTGETCISSQS